MKFTKDEIRSSMLLYAVTDRMWLKEGESLVDVAEKVLKKIDDVGFCYLTSKDVVRHPLVQKIVKAYDDFEAKEKYRSKKEYGKR